MTPKHRASSHTPLRLAVLAASLLAIVATLPGQVSDLEPAAAGLGPAAPPSDVVAKASTSASPAIAPAKHPFGAAFRSYAESRESRIGAAVLDLATGKLYVWHPHQAFNTGSIVKMQIMGAVLHNAQEGHRTLTSYERDNLVPMMEESDNDAATRLWNEMGGTNGIGDFDDAVGMSHTTLDYHWGLSTTTAPDTVKLVRTLVQKNDLYTPGWQHYALDLMEHVTDWQRWGVSAGPDEDIDTTIALKNGWLPVGDEREWIVNSIGWVDGHGRNYILAVLTDHNPSQGYGIDTIQGISRYVWSGLR